MSNDLILALAILMVGMFGAIGGFFTLYFLLKKEVIRELKHHTEMFNKQAEMFGKQAEVFREELNPIKEQVFNHIPTQIGELKDNFNHQIKEIMKLLMTYIAKK